MYPREMIQIVKNFYNNNNYTIREISMIFEISKSTIHRWLNINLKNKTPIKVSNEDIIKNTIIKIVTTNPLLTIKHIQLKIKEILNKSISYTGIYIHLKKLNFSYKKVSQKLYSNVKDLNLKI